VIHRGGNVAVVVAFEQEADRAGEPVARLVRAMEALGGVPEGGPARMLVLTVPVRAGFPAVEKLLNGLARELPGSHWWYGNVYERGDAARPLNWWNPDEGGRGG